MQGKAKEKDLNRVDSQRFLGSVKGERKVFTKASAPPAVTTIRSEMCSARTRPPRTCQGSELRGLRSLCALLQLAQGPSLGPRGSCNTSGQLCHLASRPAGPAWGFRHCRFAFQCLRRSEAAKRSAAFAAARAMVEIWERSPHSAKKVKVSAWQRLTWPRHVCAHRAAAPGQPRPRSALPWGSPPGLAELRDL